MVKERHSLPVRLRLATTLLVVLAAVRVSAAEDTSSIRLAEAPQRGAFNVGDAQANVTAVADPAAGEVLKFDYRIPKGTAAGAWTKGFPAGLKPEGIDIVRTAVKASDPEQARQVAATLEIKGTAGIQRIPLELRSDWSSHEQFVDWKTIGTLSEVVVSVTRNGDGEPATGTLALDIRFEQLSVLRKVSTSQVARLGGVLIVALLAALLLGLLGKLIGSPSRTEAAAGLRRDVVEGLGTVAILGLAAGIYALGSLGPLEVGWLPLILAVAGVILGEWWKFGLTGKHLSTGEAFRDALASGLMAASASPLAILQAPANWSELLLLSQPVAAAFVFVYHAANARRLASTGKHVGDIGLIMVATPYVIGGLLLLESGGLVRELGDMLTLGALSSRPDVAGFVGRVFVLFLFNEVVANALAWTTKRTLLRSSRAHFWLLIVAVAAIAGPWIAGFGSGTTAAKWPDIVRLIGVVMTTVLSQAGLWAEAYLLTGFITDAIHGNAPSLASTSGHPILGAKKGMVFSGVFMGGLNLLALIASVPALSRFAAQYPWVACAVLGTLGFPLIKTVIETFDGSQVFFRRVANSYRNPTLYARGAVVGLGLGLGITWALAESSMAARIWFGLVVGVAAFAGVNLVQDAIAERAGHGRIQSWRVYFVQGLLGGFIGAAIGFYLDATQVRVVIDKYHRYVDPGQSAHPFEQNALISKWGLIRLGTESGGPSLIFVEALLGVIVWSVPSWLFAINRTFMAAYFDKDTTPIRALFTRAGLVQLVENMIGVLRWGLWMSPIINSFLRPMGEPTWYNQDGAIRTVIATVHDVTSSRDEFRAWSLGVFISMLVFDWLRIAIWLDHFGLRVATLVNLSFLGMDRLDRRLARFLAPAATTRCIPEGVKRFTTWAPLLIPYYIPRGADWDYAWGKYQAISSSMRGDLLTTLAALPHAEQLMLLAGSLALSTAAFSGVRWLGQRSGARLKPALTLSNAEYEVTLRHNGEVFSRVKARDYDVSRRSYDLLDPAGRTVFLVEMTGESPSVAWPLIGNVPAELAEPSQLDRDEGTLKVINTAHGIRATIHISLPGDAAELWTITLDNPTDSARHLKVVPYLEWVLNKAEADRGHTQYNRLFAEVEYAHGLHAVLAWDKHAKALGLLASDVVPEGFLSSRMDFIGRARSIWKPRVVETLAFSAARDTDSHPTFDPIGSLLLGVTVPARGSTHLKLLIGLVADKRQAIDLIARHLQIPLASAVPDARRRKAAHSIGHGEIPPGTPEPYAEFSEDGQRLLVRTPFTTRPFDHTLSNALGHVVVVTNRGLHTTSSVNSQQNRVTPDWSDTVTREVPSEAFYLFDANSGEWFSPTLQPLNDASASYETEFSVDGSATFHMTKGTIETELTVFVPPDQPAGVYRLTIRNHGEATRRIRVAPYFQIVLAGQPEFSGPLQIRHEPSLNALFFTNPRNTYRTGPAFVSLSCESTHAETIRGRFFGAGQSLAHPYLVLQGAPFPEPTTDDRPVAAFLAELEIPAGGERTVVAVLGQAEDRAAAETVIRKYRDPSSASASLEETRRWWLALIDKISVQTAQPEFNCYVDWLKYQALAERIWARRGFYQASGAFGFRDQLQDSVNLIWMDPAIARRQILLHASQQFLEGDVVHWFHLLQDGRTGFVGRSYASDNLLWLAWGVVEYVGATGDESLLDERTYYLESDLPFEPLPAGKGGMGFDPLRSSRDDSVYRHCMRAIDLVLDRRMGVHNLPLMGTGDWNDGLDEIGSEGKGESVWLGFFLYYILDRMAPIIEQKDGLERRDYYVDRLRQLKDAIELTWRGDRYLRAFHDNGTEIGVKGSGVWEIDALTAAWAVMSGINPDRGRVVFETALQTLEKEKTILLGWPPLREDTKPYLGRSSAYPEGVRENGMYCHGVQWLVGAARILAEQAERQGQQDEARGYCETAYRLWRKISAIPHAVAGEIETYGGQPNQQAADMVTTFDPGRMIWNGYTGAAGWMFHQAIEGVLGLRRVRGEIEATNLEPGGDLGEINLKLGLGSMPMKVIEDEATRPA